MSCLNVGWLGIMLDGLEGSVEGWRDVGWVGRTLGGLVGGWISW